MRQKGQSKRKGSKNFKKTASSKIKDKIKKIQKGEELDTNDINYILTNTRNFIGCFAQDELFNLRIVNFPISLIVNLQDSGLPGSHWVALYISHTTVEIFDSLGFQPNLWPNYPYFLIEFLQIFSFKHRYKLSPVIQPLSKYCALYSIYFVLFRPYYTFLSCLGTFSNNVKENDDIVINKLLNY
jgi:hypothetical protein